MKWLAAGLTFVNAATVTALVSGMIGHGLSRGIAVFSFLIGLIAAILAYRGTRVELSPAPAPSSGKPAFWAFAAFARYRPWVWLMAGIFAIFAFRCFCWILFIDGAEYRIQSPFNLGDLSLHLTYINNFASGVPLWPDNPIYVFSKIRYPAGTDLFNALLTCLGMDVPRGLVWTGLLACAATCFAFYRWGGCFGIAGFLFNGGLVGFQFLRTYQFLDYQDIPSIAWKSIPLTMLVTQRGVLYALPVGLLLLYHWRAKYFAPNQTPAMANPPKGASDGGPVVTPVPAPSGPLPFWLELSLYAIMPLFHAHTFLALSIVLAVIFLFGPASNRREILTLVASAFIPAAFIAWLITDHFHAGSVLAFQPGWVQGDGEFLRPFSHSPKNFGVLNPFVNFLEFWIWNFGFWIPLVLGLIGWIGLRTFKNGIPRTFQLPENTVFVLAACVIFLLAFFVKTAPWGWDNIKIIVWAYFIILPFLWSELLARWPVMLRALVCVALFGSGFATLFGGMKVGRPGFGIIDRANMDAVGVAVRKLPAEARYAAYPTFNHLLLLQGRKVILGYPGHLWTQGFSYSAYHEKLTTLMQGTGNWKETARFFGARYLFWGQEEKTHFPQSTRPWEKESKLVATGAWGAIYDLESPK